MDAYEFSSDGTVTAGRYGPVVAYFDADGTVRAMRYGKEIGFVEADGTVRSTRYGAQLGSVDSDGTVRDGQRTQIGRVEAPVHKRGALMLLLG